MTIEWQQRVVDEKTELDLKICKLDAFFDSETYNQLPESQQDLLEDQFDHMREYSRILGRRIDDFESPS